MKKEPLGVIFKLFYNSQNTKILLSTYYFKLIKVNEMTSTQYTFNPFPNWDRLLWKMNTLVTHG